MNKATGQDMAPEENDPVQRGRLLNAVLRRLRSNRLARFSWRLIAGLIIIALLADLLANEKPLICSYKGTVYFPVFREYLVDAGLAEWPGGLGIADWRSLQTDWALFPPVPYSTRNMDMANAMSVSPFDRQQVSSLHYRHWLGTDELGRDILAGMIHGTRIALFIGFVSMGLAAIIGISLGAMAGFFGDERLKISRAGLWGSLIMLVPAWFYGFSVRSAILEKALGSSPVLFVVQIILSLLIFLLILWFGKFILYPLRRFGFFAQKVSVPVDIMVSRLIELMVSVPSLFLIVSIVAIAKPSVILVMLIVGLTSWTGIARLMRSELLRVRSLDYMEAAKALGYGNFRMLLIHALPNAISPVLIAVAFGIAGAILTVSTLAFLGIGLPPETLSWGTILSSSRQTPGAWWLALFPGMAIFVTVTLYNLLGEALTDALDPRQKK